MSDEIIEILQDTIEDPETEVYTFAAAGPDGNVLTFGESKGNEESFRQICAAVLVQFASATETDEKEFLKEVINEYNGRKKNAQIDHTEPKP